MKCHIIWWNLLMIWFAALEDMDTEVEIDTIWEMIRENIQISARESRLL
jgi:hypothetical protein